MNRTHHSRVLLRTLKRPLAKGVGAVDEKQAMISPETAGTGMLALGLVMGFLSPVTPLGWAGMALLGGMGTGIHVGAWLERERDPKS